MYILVVKSSITELEKAVNNKIDQGYTPQGGITTIQGTEDRGSISFVTSANSGQHSVTVQLAQAMIRQQFQEILRLL